jgi:hypothetical protein
VRTLALGASLAALGGVAHNALSLPLPLYAVETIGPAAVYGSLLAWVRLSPTGAAPRLALRSWTALNLIVGGILTVTPLPLWPFTPEQTPEHYVAHVIYASTQVPLIWLLARSRPAHSRDRGAGLGSLGSM